MSSSWPKLHAQLTRTTTTLSFQRQFQTTCDGEQALQHFNDPAALFDALHGGDGDQLCRNAILSALVRQAQANSDAAVTLMILALWPGLDAVHRRLRRHFRNDPDALVSEISTRVVTGIHALDLERVHWIAATLIRNCERDIWRWLRRSWSEAEHSRADLEFQAATLPAPSPLGLFAGLDPEAAILRIIDLLEPAVGAADARLVVAIAVEGETQHEAAASARISFEAGRKRYQRAMRRLRIAFDDIS